MDGSQTIDQRISDQLVSKIYDAAIDDSRWDDTLLELCEMLQLESALLHLANYKTGASRLFKMVGMGPLDAQTVERDLPHVQRLWNVIPGLYDRPIDAPMVASRDIPAQVFQATPLRDLWQETMVIDAIEATVLLSTAERGVLCMLRHEKFGIIDDRVISAVRFFGPHLRRAVTIADLLQMRQLRLDLFETAFDALATAIIIVDDEANVIEANAAARRLLEDGRIVSGTGNRLRVAQAEAHAKLIQAVRISGGDASAGALGIGVPLNSGVEKSLAYVLPLGGSRLRRGLSAGGKAAIFIAPPDSAGVPGLDAIAALYQLTAAESRVLEHLVQGRPLAEAPDYLDMAPGTAKTHLARIFAKTGASRQGELIARVRQLAPPVRGATGA